MMSNKLHIFMWHYAPYAPPCTTTLGLFFLHSTGLIPPVYQHLRDMLTINSLTVWLKLKIKIKTMVSKKEKPNPNLLWPCNEGTGLTVQQDFLVSMCILQRDSQS